MAKTRYSNHGRKTHFFESIRVSATCHYRVNAKDGSWRTRYIFDIPDLFGRVEHEESGKQPLDRKKVMDVLTSCLDENEAVSGSLLMRPIDDRMRNKLEIDLRRISEIREFHRSMLDRECAEYDNLYFVGESSCTEQCQRKVYVVGPKDGPYKVGFTSTSLESRVIYLQTGCPHPIRVFLSIATPMAYQIEQSVHRLLARYNTSGEWFDAPLDLVLLTVNELHNLTVEAQISNQPEQQTGEDAIEEEPADDEPVIAVGVKARGRSGGRPALMDAEKTRNAIAMLSAGKSVSSVARTLSVSRSTVLRAVRLAGGDATDDDPASDRTKAAAA